MKEIFKNKNERGNRFHSTPCQIHIFPPYITNQKMVWLSEGVKSWTTRFNMFNILTSKSWREIKSTCQIFLEPSWVFRAYVAVPPPWIHSPRVCMWQSRHCSRKRTAELCLMMLQELNPSKFRRSNCKVKEVHTVSSCVFPGTTNKTKGKQTFSYRQIEAVSFFSSQKLSATEQKYLIDSNSINLNKYLPTCRNKHKLPDQK